MTDRIRTMTVVLDKEYRVDDAESISDAIRMIKGVSKVVDGEPTRGDMDVWQAKHELRKQLWMLLRD